MSGNDSSQQSNSSDVDSLDNRDRVGDDASDGILIRSSAATNGLTTMIIAGALGAAALIIITLLPKIFFLVGILFLSASIIAFVMGFFKLNEPKHSLNITKTAILYQHRKGTWAIDWENIQRIDVPRIQKGLTQIDLEMVGFRLKNPERFLDSISPRLVTHLLMEQRPLTAQVIASNCDTGQCYGDDIIEDTKFKCADGSMLTGVTAMFANRMRKLQAGLGYDVYLSVNDIDRSGIEFVALLRDCHNSVLEQTIASQEVTPAVSSRQAHTTEASDKT
jgi:hypothetical protein